MKSLFHIQILFILVIASTLGCNDKKEKKLNEYGDYWRLVQNTSTGNCVVIQKSFAEDGNAVYTATATVVSSERCRENNFFTFLTSSEDAKAKSDSYYDGMTLVYNNYSDCSELVKTSVAARNLVTVTSLTESAQASSNGCVKVTPKIYYCKDTISSNSLSNTFRYLTTSNAKNDMRTNYDSTVSINAFANKALDLKYEDVPLGNLRISSATELTLFEGAESSSLPAAFAQEAACFKKVILGNPTLKTAYSKIPTVQEFFKEEINVSDRKAVTETITPSLVCRYGTSATELPANGSTPAVGICPISYPIF